MAVVPREAIDQFGALMEEGQLILISFFYCFLISHLWPPLLIFVVSSLYFFHFLAVILQLTNRLREHSRFVLVCSPLCSLLLTNLFLISAYQLLMQQLFCLIMQLQEYEHFDFVMSFLVFL